MEILFKQQPISPKILSKNTSRSGRISDDDFSKFSSSKVMGIKIKLIRHSNTLRKSKFGSYRPKKLKASQTNSNLW